MSDPIIPQLTARFDEISQRLPDEGIEFWFARDLMEPLDYARWENFVTAINRAIESCKTTGYDAEDHFRGVTKMIELALPVQTGTSRQGTDAMSQRYCEHGNRENFCHVCNRKEYSKKEVELIIAGTEKQQAKEIELLKQRNAELDNKICELNRLIAKQARVALKAIDDAKKHASYMLKLAQEKEKALNPALLESEREANAILTNRVQELEQALRSAVKARSRYEVDMLVAKALEGKP